jgi:lysophospholipase L1-like esterase
MLRKLILVLLMSLLILTGCQFSATRATEFSERDIIPFEEIIIENTFIPETVTLLGLGDSLTKGVGDEQKKNGYIGRLANEMKEFKGVLDVNIINQAKRGKRSDELLKQIQSGEIDDSIEKAEFIALTIGGNDIMQIVKKDLLRLRVDSFQGELLDFEKRYQKIIEEIRFRNPDAPLLLLGLYNPFSIVTDEVNEFDQILLNWNNSIESLSFKDTHACFVPLNDLFNSNSNMVYHTDFFHPNSKGYTQMTNRIIISLHSCGLNLLTKGEMDF